MALALGICFGQGQTTVDEKTAFEAELSAEMQLFEREIADLTSEIRKSHRETLRQLETQAVAAQDYDGAMVIRDKRLAIESYLRQYDAEKRKIQESKSIVLEISEAKCSGAVDPKDDYLGGWRTDKSRATWEFRGVERGKYDVVLHYSCSREVRTQTTSDGKVVKEQAGGDIEFGEDTNLLGADPPIKHNIIPTSDWNDYRQVSIGHLTLNTVAPKFRLQTTRVLPLGLMRLKGIKLIPVIEEPSGPAAPSFPTLAEIQSAFDEMIERKTGLLDRAYANELRALAKQATQEGDTKLAEEIGEALSLLK